MTVPLDWVIQELSAHLYSSLYFCSGIGTHRLLFPYTLFFSLFWGAQFFLPLSHCIVDEILSINHTAQMYVFLFLRYLGQSGGTQTFLCQ